jgi:hypothetical protein
MNTEKKRKKYEHKPRDPNRQYHSQPDKFHVRPLPEKLWPVPVKED